MSPVNSLIYSVKKLPECQNALLTWLNLTCYLLNIPNHKKEGGMYKLVGASVLLFVLVVLQSKAFALTEMNCKVKNGTIAGIQTLHLSDDQLVINNDVAIPLDKLRVKCGNMGRQIRLEGEGEGLQVILKTCSTEAKVEGHILDPENNAQALVQCDESIE